MFPKNLGMIVVRSFDRRTMKPFFCLLTLLLLVSCKNTELTLINTGSDPNWLGEPHYEVLVAVLSYNPELRVMFENEMVEELKKEGINAVPSFTVMPKLASLNAATFTKFLDADPTLAVLFAQAKNVQKEQTSSTAEEPNVFSGLFGGGEWDTTFVATMETALYVNGQTDAVWWNRVRLEAQETKVKEVVERYVRNTIKAMKQGGAVSRLK
ncbi:MULTISPECIES: hypothetical protein [unclassified Lentimonas]|uniref:hypothetical protein n=2 Tax=Lentimonas TaxID=417293 RepID=UPI0013894DDA|nr:MULTISPECIES: hypothetical protein [unclassified Lentimonas]